MPSESIAHSAFGLMAASEIIDTLKELKDRFDRSDTNLEMIIVHDCCHVKNLYEQTFPGVRVRLDLFHACMRVVQTVPKSEDFSKQFANEFSPIFCQNGDLGSERTKSTPCPDEIESNLERLLFVWRGKLKKETLDQIGLVIYDHSSFLFENSCS